MAGTYPNASATPIPLFDSYLEFNDVEQLDWDRFGFYQFELFEE